MAYMKEEENLVFNILIIQESSIYIHKRKTTTEEHSPVHRKSSKKSSPARVEKSPARGKTPTKRKAATEEKHLQGKSPKKPTPAKKSPSKTIFTWAFKRRIIG